MNGTSASEPNERAPDSAHVSVPELAPTVEAGGRPLVGHGQGRPGLTVSWLRCSATARTSCEWGRTPQGFAQQTSARLKSTQRLLVLDIREGAFHAPDHSAWGRSRTTVTSLTRALTRCHIGMVAENHPWDRDGESPWETTCSRAGHPLRRRLSRLADDYQERLGLPWGGRRQRIDLAPRLTAAFRWVLRFSTCMRPTMAIAPWAARS